MALTPNNYLRNISQVNLRDQQHAARLFVDDKFRLFPKLKFLYHVSFSINQAALKTIDLAERHKNEINMLVKSADLPNFTVTTETLNQYNRKKNIQLTHKYNALSIKFHDDSMGLINQLWQNYYSYYFADPTSAQDPGAYNRTATRNGNYINKAYGLDNSSTLPFFNYITIYQLSRHEYVSYKLHNPIIASWNHNGLDYSSTQTHDNTASIQYEAVSYDAGEISTGTPEGFGVEHYDNVPSPLTSKAGLASASPTFTTNLAKGNELSFLNNLTSTVNGYQNTQTLPPAGTPNLISVLTPTSVSGVNGVQGFSFPVSTTTNGNITASPVNLG